MAGTKFRVAWFLYGILGSVGIPVIYLILGLIIQLLLNAIGVNTSGSLFGDTLGFLVMAWIALMAIGILMDLADQSRLYEQTWVERMFLRGAARSHKKAFHKKLGKDQVLLQRGPAFLGTLRSVAPKHNVDQFYIVDKKTGFQKLRLFFVYPAFLIVLIPILIFQPMEMSTTYFLIVIFFAISISLYLYPLYFVLLVVLKKHTSNNHEFIGQTNGIMVINLPNYTSTTNYLDTATRPEFRRYTVYDDYNLIFYKMDGAIGKKIDFTKYYIDENEIQQILDYIAKYHELFEIITN